MPAVTVIIPARLASTRLPQKVLLALTGMPLVQHVAEAAVHSRRATRVVVAVDDQRIIEALRPYGTSTVLTSVSHPNGTSRLAEAAGLLGLADDEIVVNAQGDEPEMAGAVIDAAVDALLDTPGADVGTVAALIAENAAGDAEFANPNVVKVVIGGGRALYFSRSAIPHERDAGSRTIAQPRLRHIGVYAYRVSFLRRYVSMAPTPLEQIEALEQLRVLENGGTIGIRICETAAQGIDTPEQYAAFVRRFAARASVSAKC